MPLNAGFSKKRLALLAVAATAMAYAGPASAWSRHHDHVYADSFGNLVIESAAGYKRILVGEEAWPRSLRPIPAPVSPRRSMPTNMPVRTATARRCS